MVRRKEMLDMNLFFRTRSSRSLTFQVQTGGARKRPGNTVVRLRSEDYSVILHADACHHVPFVAAMLAEVIAVLETHRAITVAKHAFTVGRAVVITCNKSMAERYRDQLTLQYQLVVTLEAA